MNVPPTVSFFESMESMVTTWTDVPAGTTTFFGFGGGGGSTAATGGAGVFAAGGAAGEVPPGGAAGGAAEFPAGTSGVAPAVAPGLICIESFTFVTPGEV